VRALARIDARAEQALRRVDVAHADDAPPVHEELLDGHAAAPRQGVKTRAVEPAGQRLDAKAGKQSMRPRFVRRPQHCTEAPRIAQPQYPVAEREVDVVVLFRRRAWRQQPQASRHPQVHEDRSVAAVEQEVLAAPAHGRDASPGERANVRRHGPAQARLAHLHGRDRAAGDAAREAASGHFDFGKLGHGTPCAGHQIYLRSVEPRCDRNS